MRNLKFIISYNGRNYAGYQIQPNVATIQNELQKAMSAVFNQNVIINGCSRTDAGVNARGYCYSSFADNVKIPEKAVVNMLNSRLPHDIAVLSCEEVPPDFHARFSCRGKRYIYLLNRGGCKDVFCPSLLYSKPLDLTAMRAAADLLTGEHDFAAFCAAEAKERLTSTVRTITEIGFKETGNFFEIAVSGGGFLHNMVRIAAGTLLCVSEGRRSLEDVRTALTTGDRTKAGITLPAEGLYLDEVFY